MNVKNTLTVALTTFLGGAVGALSTSPGTAFLSWDTAKPVLALALVAGLGALYHLYQPAPKVAS